MKVVTLISFLFLLGFVHESFGYGTIFTDNITPAFKDSTYFKGIKTETAFSTNAEVGVIGATNLLGFTINSPVITTDSDSFSISGSHDILFGNLDTTHLTFHSDGDFITTSQRTDIDGQTIGFSGTGDVFVGGLDSTVRANEFLLSSLSTLSLRATGDELRISAPVDIAFALSKDVTLDAERNIQVTSETSSVSFVSKEGFDISANHIDLDGSTSLLFDIDNDITFSAGSIVEFLPVGDFVGNLNELDVLVSSGDIQLIASSRIHFTGDNTQSGVFLTGQDNAFFTIKSASEATMAVVAGQDVTIRATEQITFASFLDQSDLSLAAVDSINHIAPVIEITTVKGTAIAAGTLSVSAFDYVHVEVLGEDMYHTAINGPISYVTTTGNFSLATNEDFVGEAANIYQKTDNNIRVFAQNILYKQDNVDSSGVITVNVASDIEVNAGQTLFATAGDHFWNVAGDATVDATDTIFFNADKGYDNDLEFSVNGDLVIVAKDRLTYYTSVLVLDGTDYGAQPDDDYRINTQRSFRQLTDGPSAGFASDISWEAPFGDLTFRILGDATLASTAGDYTHTAFTHEFEADNINLQSSDILVSVLTHLTAEVSGNVLWTLSDRFELEALGTIELSSDTFSLTSLDDFSVEAGQAIQISQNFPGDTLNLNSGTISAQGSTIDILSGGDLNWQSSDLSISGPTSTYKADQILEVHSTTIDISSDEVDIISGGNVLFNAVSLVAQSVNNFQIDGPQGQFGLTSFRAGSSLQLGASNQFLVDAEDISFASTTFANVNGGATQFTVPVPRLQDEARSRFLGNTLLVDAGQFTGESDFVNIFANSLVQRARTYLLDVEDTVKITTPAEFRTTFDDVSINTVSQAFAGDALTLKSGALGTFEAETANAGVGNFEGYSGVDYLFTVDNKLTITAPIVTVNSEDLLSMISKSAISAGFTGDVSIRSGGKTLWSISGPVTYDANNLATMQSFYTKITTQQAISFTAQVSDTLLQATDGFAKFTGNDFMTLNSGAGQTEFSAGNDIVMYSQVAYTASADSGATSTLTPSVGFQASSLNAEGAIVFDALAGQISGQFADTLIYRTNSYTDVVGAAGVSWTSVTDIGVTVFKDFNISSIANTKFTSVGNFVHKVGKYAYFQSENAYLLDGDRNLLLQAADGILVSTGEQGQLELSSAKDMEVVTTNFQHWRSADSFTVISQNNGIDFNSALTDISIFTAGGQIALQSPTGGSYSDQATNNMYMFSGDYTKIQSGSDQTWTAGTQVRALTKGDIFFDGASSGSYQFDSANQQTWNSDGTRFDQDGIELSGPSFTQTATSTANYNPLLSLLFGGQTRPTLAWNAGGSAAQAGFILQSDGNIFLDTEAAQYDATQNYYLNVFKNAQISSDSTLHLEASTGAMTFLADAGNLKYFAETLTSTATTSYSITATAGIFEILSSSSNPGTRVYFQADSTITTNANTFTSVSADTAGTFNSVRYATTNAAKWTSIDGAQGSLTFSGADLNSLTAKGAITIHTLGQDGSVLVQAGMDLSVLTKTSSDITFKAAGNYQQGSGGATTFSAGTALSFISESVDGSDYTKGDVRFFAKDTISMSAQDTMEFSALGNVLIQADSAITVTTTGPIETESYDDTVIAVANTFTSTATGILTFANSPGGGGSLNFITNQPADDVTFTIRDDVTWDLGANVYGYATEPITFSSAGSNGQNIAQSYSTTAVGGNMKFNSRVNTQFRADNDVFINSNGPLSVLGYLNSGFTVQGSPNQPGLSFTSSAGNIRFASNLGSINTQAQGGTTLTATTSMSLTAAGISRDSGAGISVSAPAGSSTFGAGTSITVDADEAIIFDLDHLGARFTVGASRFIDFGTTGNTATTSTTLFKATGHQADIVLNLREARDGIGYLRLLAGAADPLLDYTSPHAVVNVFATESVRFEQESGFTFAGIYPETFAAVTGKTSLFPSDVFFNADGDHSSIEVSTTKEAVLANIDILTQSLILEADGKLTIASFGESGSSVEFKSATEAVKIQSFSTTSTDGIFLNAYNGDAAFVAEAFGEIHLEPERNLMLSSTRGFRIQANSFNMDESLSTYSVSVLDGDLNLDFVDLDLIGTQVFFTTQQPDDETGASIYFESNIMQLTSTGDTLIRTGNLGNIVFRFAQGVDMTGVGEVIFAHPSSMAIPMRESDLVAGEICYIPGELVIYRNLDFNDNFSLYSTRIDNDNDSGVQLCFCMSTNIWACRSLSNAQPFP